MSLIYIITAKKFWQFTLAALQFSDLSFQCSDRGVACDITVAAKTKAKNMRSKAKDLAVIDHVKAILSQGLTRFNGRK